MLLVREVQGKCLPCTSEQKRPPRTQFYVSRRETLHTGQTEDGLPAGSLKTIKSIGRNLPVKSCCVRCRVSAYPIPPEVAAAKRKYMGGCAPNYRVYWCSFGVCTCAEESVVAKRNLVSTFLAKRIQINFAENKSWPTSAVWQKCPTQVLAGSMRRRKKKTKSGQPTWRGCNSYGRPSVRTIFDRQSLCNSSGGLRSYPRLPGALQWASTFTKPVAQASRRTEYAWKRHGLTPLDADIWVLWMTGRWQALKQSNRRQPTFDGHRNG